MEAEPKAARRSRSPSLQGLRESRAEMTPPPRRMVMRHGGGTECERGVFRAKRKRERVSATPIERHQEVAEERVRGADPLGGTAVRRRKVILSTAHYNRALLKLYSESAQTCRMQQPEEKTAHDGGSRNGEHPGRDQLARHAPAHSAQAFGTAYAENAGRNGMCCADGCAEH